MICPRCGQPGTAGQYCGRCGLHLVGSTGPVRLDKPTQQFGVPPTGPVSAYPPPDPATRYAMPGSVGAAGGPPRRSGGGRIVVLVAVVALLVLAGGATAFLAFRGGSGEATSAVAAPAPGTTPPPPTTSASKAAVGGAAPSTVVLTTTVTPTVASTAATGLSDIADQPIACNSGSFVLLASERDEASFVRRVDEVRAAGQLPAGARWTRTSSGCGLFSSDAWVLWSGPYPTAADACPIRLAAPFDASVRSTAPGDSSSSSCACVTAVGSPPVLYSGSARSQWTGELQRLLQLKLDYDVGDLNSSTWGVFTPAVADAVRRFQADQGLTVDGEVGAQTWTALRSAGC